MTTSLFRTGRLVEPSDYDDYARRMSARWVGLLALVLGGAMLVFWPVDWVVFDPGSPPQRVFFTMRIGFIPSCALALLALRVDRLRCRAEWVLVGMALGCVASGGVALAVVPGSGMERPWLYSGYLLPFATIGLVISLRRRIVVTAAITLAPMLLFFGLNARILSDETLIIPLLVVSFACVMSVATGEAMSRLLHRDFFRSLELAQKRDELRGVNDFLSGRLEAKAADLSRLVGELDESVEAERAHISRELHDELGQVLSGLRIEVALAKAQTGAGDPAREALDRVDRLLGVALDTLNGIVHGLRPRAVDELGLVDAVKELVASFERRTGVECLLGIEPPDLSLSADHEGHVYRVLQEALTNVGRHAAARRVEVRLEARVKGLLLSVRDDGRGLTAGDPFAVGRHGLVGMRERAEALGGELAIASEPEVGTVVRLEVPAERLL